MRHQRPKLGQHFLADTTYRRRIVEALGISSHDTVIEIGAGRGAMTGLLAERAQRVVAIEIDSKLAQQLQESFRERTNVEVLQADILEADLAGLCRKSEKCLVFGNLPYYITSPIIQRLLEFRDSIRCMGLLVQREVAQRLSAAPGGRDYGYLSVLTQLYSRPNIVLRVPAGAFSPPPQVQSSLVRLEIHAASDSSRHGLPPQAEEAFLEFVKRCFAQKRKNLLNNLAKSHGRGQIEQALAVLNLSPSARAEELSVEQFVKLFQRLEPRG